MTEPVQLALISTIGTIVIGIIGLINLSLTKSNAQAISKASNMTAQNRETIKDTNLAVTSLKDHVNSKMDLLLKTTIEKADLQGRADQLKEQAVIVAAVAAAEKDTKPMPVNVVNDEIPVDVNIIKDVVNKNPLNKEGNL